ncbi:MAG: hypothetical protein A3E36_03875 [Candidatus Andersenbacteria bacterium RIFCSPHIGHO2_12_FULL_45_11b]|uniref:EF-hand domain-containing protein n=1 Tax=Candidatus Andersenbacteria bacterium RIFCSPHIGHO2_12_FULL_45_11b TaxID=1797282 RepID=A0A1G1X9X7_9BACT|nr:MAG: hypothetical protein A3E36_03875 [Candidatus Andersenbacteria bacterium RIFCSPHIGHO2_12_FULL_45_11b]
MNWRVLIAIVVGAVILIAGGVFAYVSVFSGNNAAQQESPSPTPSSAGALPVGSIAPDGPRGPVAFRGVCPDTWAGQTDADGDSLPDSAEAIYGTDADNPDTDGDGYNDGAEVRAGYDPTNSNSSTRLDSDHDELLDSDECKWHTDPFNPDSDGDGFLDGAEVKSGFDPTKKGNGQGSDRLPTPTPGIVRTPNTTATPAPYVPPSSPGTSGGVTMIPTSQLVITNDTSAAAVQTYLVTIDGLRPQELSDGQTITNAIQTAASGNPQPLIAATTRVQQFATALQRVSTPKNAEQYHQMYVSLISFTAQQLQIISQNATSNPQVATQAVLDIQDTLPNYVTQLAQLRQQLETIASGG